MKLLLRLECSTKLLLRLDASLPRGIVGEPARDRSDGVFGPEYSARVIGRGPEAYELRRLSDAYCGRGAAMELRRDEGRDEAGESISAES
jgi:hypothetical protein